MLAARLCSALILTTLALAPAAAVVEHIGVRFEPAAAPGLVAVHDSEEEVLIAILPLARLIDITPGEVYTLEGQEVELPHLVVRFERFDRIGKREIHRFIVRVGDQHRVALLENLAAAR